MKTYLFLAIILTTSQFSIAQKNKGLVTTPAWEQDYQFEALADQADGGSVSIDITNTGSDINDCISKAKSQALFTIIFKGYGKTNQASASTALSDMAGYNQNLDFYKGYLSSNTAGLAHVNKAQTNMSKPGGKISKKVIKSTTTVYIMKTKLREDLEKQGFIKSAESIAESLGSKPSVLIVPSNRWMETAGFVSTEESDMGQVVSYDYQSALKSSKMASFGTLEGFLTATLDNTFRMQSLSSIMESIGTEMAENNMRDDVTQENSLDLLARTAQADLWIYIDAKQESLSGGQELQYTITLNALDPMINEMVINGLPQTVKTSGNNETRLLETTVNANIDNVRPKILDYFIKREENGLQGKITFLIGEDVGINFEDEIDVDGDEYAFAEIIDAMVGKKAKKYTPKGRQTTTRRTYDVWIDTKIENKLSGKVESNNFEKFGRKVKSEIKKLGSVKAIVETRGLGNVVVVFTEEL
ncbi:MAG: DUF6175 family protein [Flavobacteriales bacterium]